MTKSYDDFDWSTCPHDRYYTKSLFEHAREFPFERGLEIGFGHGSSTLAFLRGSEEATLLSIDKEYPVESYNFFLGLEENARRHEILLEDSATFLPDLIGAGKKFDFVYIDGDHRFEPSLQDIGNSANLLCKRGIMIVDDASYEMDMGVHRALVFFLSRTNIQFNVTPLPFSPTGAVRLERLN